MTRKTDEISPTSRDYECQDADEAIANAIFHKCGKYLECKNNDLEAAGLIIISYLKKCGFFIVKIV